MHADAPSNKAGKCPTLAFCGRALQRHEAILPPRRSPPHRSNRWLARSRGSCTSALWPLVATYTHLHLNSHRRRRRRRSAFLVPALQTELPSIINVVMDDVLAQQAPKRWQQCARKRISALRPNGWSFCTSPGNGPLHYDHPRHLIPSLHCSGLSSLDFSNRSLLLLDCQYEEH